MLELVKHSVVRSRVASFLITVMATCCMCFTGSGYYTVNILSIGALVVYRSIRLGLLGVVTMWSCYCDSVEQ